MTCQGTFQGKKLQLTSAEGRDSIALYGKLSCFSDSDVSLRTNLKKHSTLIVQSSGFQVALECMTTWGVPCFFKTMMRCRSIPNLMPLHDLIINIWVQQVVRFHSRRVWTTICDHKILFINYLTLLLVSVLLFVSLLSDLQHPLPSPLPAPLPTPLPLQGIC